MQKLSQNATVQALTASNFKAVSDSLPTAINRAIDQPPICEVIKITGHGQVVAFVEFELIKVVALVSVGNNLNDSQIQFVATQLVEMFPNESLADFKIAFQRGCMGQYGEIFRMDGIVLRGWMEKYLDEKYQVVEDKLMKERDTPFDKIPKVEEGPGFKLAKEYAEKLSGGKKVPSLTDAEIRTEGQENPKKRSSITKGYTWFNVRGVQINAMTQEHAEELAAKMVKAGILEEYEPE